LNTYVLNILYGNVEMLTTVNPINKRSLWNNFTLYFK
jgi:hypothetical protein